MTDTQDNAPQMTADEFIKHLRWVLNFDPSSDVASVWPDENAITLAISALEENENLKTENARLKSILDRLTSEEAMAEAWLALICSDGDYRNKTRAAIKAALAKAQEQGHG